jgi:peptide/nickel transport system ATP-binding protein
VEMGPVLDLFRSAAHPYTQRLIFAIPHLTGGRELIGIGGRAPSPGRRPQGCSFAPRCTWVQDRCKVALPELRPVAVGHQVRCVRAEEVRSQTLRRGADGARSGQAASQVPVLTLKEVNAGYRRAMVVHDINIEVARQECLALVGESGSGKTTLARSVAGLHSRRTGKILLNGAPLADAARDRPREQRRTIQYVFQNPYGSLNPRRTIGHILRQPLELFGHAKNADAKVAEMLDRVSLSASYAHRYPDQLSGGERQRVAIARALVCDPQVLICDEVTSALDVSVQAAIVELLASLQRDLGLAMLFVTHNLPLVRSIAQRVAVMSHGRIVELGGVDEILGSPSDEYTKRLLSDTPSLEVALETAESV